MTRPGQPTRNRHDWTDEQILQALHDMDHAGLSATEAGRRMGANKSIVLGLRFRALRESRKHFPSTHDDGSLEPGWWRR